MSKITEIEQTKKKIQTITIDGIYKLQIPDVITFKKGQKINFKITKEPEKVKNSLVELHSQVFRTFDSHTLISSGGLLGEIPNNIANIDEELFIYIYN